MTDSDIRTLKKYLAKCLLPNITTAAEYVAKFEHDEAYAETNLDADIAGKMRRYYQGQVDALQQAIYDFRELFEEELKEGE